VIGASLVGCNSLLGIHEPLKGQPDGGAGSGVTASGGGTSTGDTAAVATGGAGAIPGAGSGGKPAGGTGGAGAAGGTGAGGAGAAGAGAAGTGGVNTGGVGTGGAGTGGAGAGGMPCQASATQCSGSGVQTCQSNGTWGAAVACGQRQSCTGAPGSAACSCKADPVCKALGASCSNASTLSTCLQDPQACFYELTSPCANGACTGPAGSASCCTNACTVGTTQCAGASVETCSLGGNSCTQWTASMMCATGQVCERYTNPACVSPDWAEWAMPNVAGDVGTGAPNPVSYTDNMDGTVTDNVTKLMWQKEQVPGYSLHPDARAFCSMLSLGGHHDWRLPSAIELISILDYGQSNPAINVTFFPTLPDQCFWSSTLSGADPSMAWCIYFGLFPGTEATAGMDSTYSVRCVR